MGDMADNFAGYSWSEEEEMELRKVTLNLFDDDCNAMAEVYGYGWSEIVRNLVHEHMQELRANHPHISEIS